MWSPGLGAKAAAGEVGKFARSFGGLSRTTRFKNAAGRFGGHLLRHKGKYGAGVAGLAAAGAGGAYAYRRYKRRHKK